MCSAHGKDTATGNKFSTGILEALMTDVKGRFSSPIIFHCKVTALSGNGSGKESKVKCFDYTLKTDSISGVWTSR